MSGLFFTASAQKYFFDTYGVQEGLSEQKVYTLIQDSKDYIWLGTANGLSRFDGEIFENFSIDNGLAVGGVRSIMEDPGGNIWFGHLNGGVSRYNGNIFETVAFDSVTLTGDITSITLANDSSLWFTSYLDGALRCGYPVKDIKHLKGKQFRGRDGLGEQVVGSALTRAGDFICIADVGTRRYVPTEDKFENYRMPHMTTYFNPVCMLEDTRGNLWFGTHNGGIFKYILSESRMEEKDLIRNGMASNWITCFLEDSMGRIWVGTWGGGVALFEGDSLRIMNEMNGLEAGNIYKIIEDVEGNILIASLNNGLYIFKGDAFLTINDEKNLPSPDVFAICGVSNNDIWIGTNAGISVYRPGSGNPPVIYNKASDEIPEEIRFIKEDREGNIWIGSNSGGVILFNTKKSRFESQTYINGILHRDNQVKALEIDKNNNLWIGTNEGVAVGTINQENFQRFISLDSLPVNVITSLYCDPEGNMWIGTDPRPDKPCLIRYDPVTESASGVKGLSSIVPKTMVMDTEGVLWIGTNQGLFAYRDSVILKVTQNDGLLSNNINLLSIDNSGCIYIGTNYGLNRYFPKTKRIHSYTARNGFTGIETRPNAVYKTPSNDFWFGTANGAIHLRTEKMSTRELEPLTHIKGIQVNYSPRAMVPGMKLNFKDRTIRIDYYSLSLTNPDAVKYRVKLEGADKDWQPVTSQTYANYPALAHGKYTFNVIAGNSEGLWNSKPVTFSFMIRPPFYKTWWFIFIMSLMTLAAFITYIRIRERNLVKEKLELEEKVKERTAEVVQKSKEIEEKNRDITASIRYAERIQRAMLPRQDMFHDTFVLFMPKDIVSGDFYWMYDNGDYQFIAVCDCTGHGVPGAFMSIIGHNSLNKVVREYGITRPAAILDQLNTEVLKALMQRHEEIINDGMDMTLIAYNRKKGTLEFSGAYNSLYVVRNGEVVEHKGDRFPIGMTAIGSRKSFTNQNIIIQPGDMIYMNSDGYADQFGSAEVKKFKSVNVKKLLTEIWEMPVEDQRKRLESEIITWKGGLEQVDDILFVGTRIPQN